MGFFYQLSLIEINETLMWNENDNCDFLYFINFIFVLTNAALD